MAKCFSIAIPYEGKNHTALVNIHQQGCDLVCLVRYTDKKLQLILDHKNLEFGLLEGLIKPVALFSRSAEYLVENTIGAITAYLQKASV